MYKRILMQKIQEKLFMGKAVIIYGPRQVGKTTLLKEITKIIPANKKTGYFSCDDPIVKQSFTNKSVPELKSIIKENDVVIIDEAQLVENIGITLKLLVDNFPNIQVMATGSSSFDLANKIVEPLTGRAYEFSLYGLSIQEIEEQNGRINVLQNINNYLTYGLYPAIVSEPQRASDTIKMISGGFLYKDILAYEGIRKPELLEKILIVLARAIGGAISIQSISDDVDANQQTVTNYLYLLEQAHIIYTLQSFESNDITSIKIKKKYFITDTGIRNSLVGGYEGTDTRIDIGQLWETLCIMERIKFHTNNGRIPKIYYWRNNKHNEVDLVDMTPGYERAFEFTYSEKAMKKKKIPKKFTEYFPKIPTIIVYKDNFEELYI